MNYHELFIGASCMSPVLELATLVSSRLIFGGQENPGQRGPIVITVGADRREAGGARTGFPANGRRADPRGIDIP